MELDDIAALMGMKPASIADVYEVDDGLLVVTSEGAQTLVADGRCSAVYPRRELPTVLVVDVDDGVVIGFAGPGGDMSGPHLVEAPERVVEVDCGTCGGRRLCWIRISKCCKRRLSHRNSSCSNSYGHESSAERVADETEGVTRCSEDFWRRSFQLIFELM